MSLNDISGDLGDLGDDFFETLDDLKSERSAPQGIAHQDLMGNDNTEAFEKANKLEEHSKDVTVIGVKSSSDLPQLIGKDYPELYQHIVDRFLAIYKRLPILDYDALHAEISDLNVDSSPTPTLQLINLKLQNVQASKDRLGEIYQAVIRCYTFKKRAVNILTDSWSQFATGKSQDKRKADASLRLSIFHLDLAQVEALHSVCEHSLRNLDSQSNAISRQITIIQSQLKLFEIGRGALPDFDFNKSSLNESFDSLGDNEMVIQGEESKDINPSESKKAEELSF